MITSVAWSPNGQRVLTGSQDGTARIWDADTGEVIHTYTGNWVRDVVWTQGGPRVVTGSADGAAHVWDVITSGELVTLRDEGAMAAPTPGALTAPGCWPASTTASCASGTRSPARSSCPWPAPLRRHRCAVEP